jgi:hypothetical protein
VGKIVTVTRTHLRYAAKAFGADVDLDTGEIVLISPVFTHPWVPVDGSRWRAYPTQCGRYKAHLVPDPRCFCGIYGAYDLQAALDYGMLVGLVRPVGRTIPASGGWRAAGAICEMLSTPYPEVLDHLPECLRAKLVPWQVLENNLAVPLEPEESLRR